MTEENLVDSGHQLMLGFSREFQSLESPESFRSFVLKYFDTLKKKQLVLSIISLAELNDPDLLKSDEFKVYFRWLSCREFAKKTASFQDEKIRLGLSL